MRLMFALAVALGFMAVNVCLLLYAEDKPVSDSQPSGKPPISLRLETTQNIYSSRQGLMIRLELIANERAKVCIADDIMSQLQVKVNKSGVSIPLKPLVVNDNSTVFRGPSQHKWLEPGQKLTYHINLKRLKFADGTQWMPGEYSASAVYMLCPQIKDKPETELTPLEEDEPGDDIPVKSTKPVWFMIMS